MPFQKGQVGFQKNSTTPKLINILLGQAIQLLVVAQNEGRDPADRHRALTMAHDLFEQADRRFLECYGSFIPPQDDSAMKSYEELTRKAPHLRAAKAAGSQS